MYGTLQSLNCISLALDLPNTVLYNLSPSPAFILFIPSTIYVHIEYIPGHRAKLSYSTDA